MCLIVTTLLFVMSIQNLLQAQWLIGSVQLLISFGFLWLLIRNIKQAKCDREGKGCESGCALPSWITNVFKKTK